MVFVNDCFEILNARWLVIPSCLIFAESSGSKFWSISVFGVDSVKGIQRYRMTFDLLFEHDTNTGHLLLIRFVSFGAVE